MRNALTLKTDVESHNFMKRKQQEEEMDNKVTLFTTNVNNNEKRNKGDNICNTENKKINDKAEAQCCTGCIMF
jgi:hypothetical protein